MARTTLYFCGDQALVIEKNHPANPESCHLMCGKHNEMVERLVNKDTEIPTAEVIAFCKATLAMLGVH
jgi:hypothetical protein